MHGVRSITALTIMLAVAFNAAAGGDAQGIAPKPQSPLSVTIETQDGGPNAKIQPGQVIDLRIVVRSHIDLPVVNASVSAVGGAEIVAGEMNWSGPLQKSIMRFWNISVRTPQKGEGKVVARVEEGAGSNKAFRAEAFYELGKSTGRKPAAGKRVKSRQGRDVIEYEVK